MPLRASPNTEEANNDVATEYVLLQLSCRAVRQFLGKRDRVVRQPPLRQMIERCARIAATADPAAARTNEMVAPCVVSVMPQPWLIRTP